MPSDLEALRVHFLDLVTDENLRERIAAQTEGVRNVILSLAFGSLANSTKRPFLTVAVGPLWLVSNPLKVSIRRMNVTAITPSVRACGKALSSFKYGR